MEALGDKELKLAGPPRPTSDVAPKASSPEASLAHARLAPEPERIPKERAPRLEPREEDGKWMAPPPALLPPIERSAPVAPAVGTAMASAEAAALAERVLTSLRVGRVSGMPEVRMRLGNRGVEVRLRLDEGRVVPVLVAERPGEAAALAERLDRLFAEQGIEAEPVVVERG
ncbi:MAG: flagellar hook-length control protein FliK [Myxococcales bacterium]|nr:flagellar hook-length control protein FliK [Myxococcales bacterium]